MYALLFSTLCRKLVLMVFFDNAEAQTGFFGIMFTTKLTYVVMLYMLLLPVVVKKQVAELRFVSYLLFGGVISMMLIFIVKAFVMGGYVPSEGAEINEYSKGSIFDSISIILTSYGFFINFYPIYSSLDNPTNKNAMKATGLAMALYLL